MAGPEPGFTPYLFPSTTLIVDVDNDLGAGTFEVRESDIAWTPNASSSSPACAERLVPLRSVSLSAIATDASARACLYLQIDDGSGEANGEALSGEQAADPLELLSEMYLVFPSDDDLHKAFEAMCQGALRNPDSDEDDGGDQVDGDGLGGWFTAGSLAEGLDANVGLGDSDREMLDRVGLPGGFPCRQSMA